MGRTGSGVKLGDGVGAGWLGFHIALKIKSFSVLEWTGFSKARAIAVGPNSE